LSDSAFDIENTPNNDGYSVISSVDHSTTSSRSNSPIQLSNSQSTTDLLQKDLSDINVQRTDETSIPQINNDQDAIHTKNINVPHFSSTTQDDQFMNSNNFSEEETGSSHANNSTTTELSDDPYNCFDDMTEILSEIGKNKNDEVQSPTIEQADDQFLKTTETTRIKENVDVDYKKHIRAAIEGHKYYKKNQSINITYGKDLYEYIPGLYRLLDLCKDDGSNGLVDKIIISKDSLKKLCNDMVPYSFTSISEIEYNRLNTISFRLIGCYGNHLLIAKLLLKMKIINSKLFDLLTMSRSSGNKQEAENQPNLRSGIYLLMINPDIGLVIHWPEIGCYEDNATSQKKKNMTNLHRYLTKLTDQQICFMSEKDLENFNWGVENEEQDSEDEENNMCYEFEVKKSQEEQEDFKLHPGFTINLPLSVKKELENKCDSSLTPIVVESAHNQTFITRKKITSAFAMKRLSPTINKFSFKKEFQSRTQGYAVEIDRKMSMKALEVLIKDGLDRENEFLSPLRDAIAVAKRENDLKKEMEKNAIKNDAELVTAMSREKLKELYGKTSMETPNVQIDNSVVERINAKYPDMQQNITKATKINSNTWKKLKSRYYFARLITAKAYQATNTDENKIEIGQSSLKLLYSIFMDEENDMHKVVKKCTERKKNSEAQTGLFNMVTSSLTSFFYPNSSSKVDSRRIDDTLKEANGLTNRNSDNIFIQSLYTGSWFNSNEEIRKGIIDAFFREYSKWRNDTFVADVKGILPKSSGPLGKEIDRKLDEEFTLLKRDLETREFVKICKKIEEKYSTGRKFKIIDIIESYYHSSFLFTYEIETTQPDQLQITVFETSLEQSDTFEITENELHVPKPRLITNSFGHAGISFQINPDAFRLLNTEEHCMFAINEPRGLVGILHTQSGVLHVYAFDEGYVNLFPRNSNVPILQWYNFKAPDMQHFFFIKDTEELCFVEVGGRARIYNLVNGQFRPGTGQIPANATNVMSTPDGACIVAFVKETIPKVEEKYFAYIYFCTSFGKPGANKVIEMPLSMQSFEYHQFSLIHKRQIHITTLDLKN
ncbi:4874_t:CDS:10, partial [Gigaspora rosea]